MEQPLPMSLPPLLPPTSGFGSSMRPGDGEGYPPGGPPGPPFPGDGPLPPNRAPTPENMSPNPNSNPGKYKEKKNSSIFSAYLSHKSFQTTFIFRWFQSEFG